MSSLTEKQSYHFSNLTLVLLISFASVNAVLFTPALPSIAKFFGISEVKSQATISWYLIGYALGQLFYGPIANRFGRKPALYGGIGLQIFSSILCVFAGKILSFDLLVIARFLLAAGAGVGLKITFTLINECFDSKTASQKISYLMLAFAVTPGLAVALGGILNSHFGWESCFYALAGYGLLLMFLVSKFPETQKILDLNAMKFNYLFKEYASQFKNTTLLAGGILMGCCSSFVYIFAALSPFIAIDFLHMTSATYGMANLLPPIGLISGSLLSAQLVKRFPLRSIVMAGIILASLGCIFMTVSVYLQFNAILSLFVPTIFIYFGLSFVLGNASSLAMSHTTNKAHGSAVMNFLNMGVATAVVLSVGLLAVKISLLPMIFIVLCIAMVLVYKFKIANIQM